MRKSKKPKRINQIMEEMDSPHSENFNLTKTFQEQGASAPSISQTLVNSFCSAFENAESEHTAHKLFSMGALREYFQAWIIPKMPDMLQEYISELDSCGYPVRTGFDGSPYIMVRYRGAVHVEAEEVGEEEVAELPVYSDDWSDDLSDIKPPFEENED